MSKEMIIRRRGLKTILAKSMSNRVLQEGMKLSKLDLKVVCENDLQGQVVLCKESVETTMVPSIFEESNRTVAMEFLCDRTQQLIQLNAELLIRLSGCFTRNWRGESIKVSAVPNLLRLKPKEIVSEFTTVSFVKTPAISINGSPINKSEIILYGESSWFIPKWEAEWSNMLFLNCIILIGVIILGFGYIVIISRGSKKYKIKTCISSRMNPHYEAPPSEHIMNVKSTIGFDDRNKQNYESNHQDRGRQVDVFEYKIDRTTEAHQLKENIIDQYLRIEGQNTEGYSVMESTHGWQVLCFPSQGMDTKEYK